MNNGWLLSLFEHLLIWCLPIWSEPIPVDMVDCMLNDPWHKWTFHFIWVSSEMICEKWEISSNLLWKIEETWVTIALKNWCCEPHFLQWTAWESWLLPASQKDLELRLLMTWRWLSPQMWGPWGSHSQLESCRMNDQVESHLKSSETHLCDSVADVVLSNILSTMNEKACESMNVLLCLLRWLNRVLWDIELVELLEAKHFLLLPLRHSNEILTWPWSRSLQWSDLLIGNRRLCTPDPPIPEANLWERPWRIVMAPEAAKYCSLSMWLKIRFSTLKQMKLNSILVKSI